MRPALPLRSTTWLSTTVLSAQPEWTGTVVDTQHLIALFHHVLGPHRDELGLQRVRCVAGEPVFRRDPPTSTPGPSTQL